MKRTADFQTIRSEGGLLPPDLLRRVLDPKAKLDGTRPEDYGLPQGERLNEVITQSWNRLRRHWGEFREVASREIGSREERNREEGNREVASSGSGPGDIVAESSPNSLMATRYSLREAPRFARTGLTNDKWSLPLLRELGFGLLPTSAGPEIGGRSYAISRFFGPVPVHLVGCGLSLDRRAAGQRGAAAANPHGLVQEFLNRSPAHLWALVSNGLRLRVLRDNQALSRQSFLEFDLEAMFAGEVYSDFVLLWLMAHATRWAPRAAPREGERPENCWLEQWTKLANEQGTRALGDLRAGVERALQVLGEGFASHPKNTALREALRSGRVPLADFHGQLLRVVYRLIFLFVVEDRTIDGVSLLHAEGSREVGSRARDRYAAYYSTARLREMAGKIKGSRHGDLWEQFNLIVGALSGDPRFAAVREHLALPALGSFLWDPNSTASLLPNSLLANSLPPCSLTNHDFLEALRDLAFTRQGKVLRPVDYKNLGSDEFGGVYESFLALTPQLNGDGTRFSFAEFAGNERKTSGSYYTDDTLVQCLLDSALDPVVLERLEEARELASREIASRGREIYANRILSRPDRVAESDGSGGAVLPADQAISQGRAVRHDVTDPPGVSLDTSQHRGGLGPGGNQGIHSVPPDRTGQPEGAGNAPDPFPKGGTGSASAGGASSRTQHRSGQDDAFPDWFFAAQAEVGPNSLPPYSLLAEKALLSLKICDSAVGSGHFLVGAGHRLAWHLARVRALAQGESEPSPLLYQTALRDVIGHCLYGVDINPMAVELCKVTLWLEAMEPGEPLSFLDHHIRVGNSLLGTTPELIAAGLPDNAFTAIEGDDKKVCAALKRRNKQEREGQQDMLHMMVAEQAAEYSSIEARTRGIDEGPDDTIDEIQRKADRFRRVVVSPEYQHAHHVADAWCAAFVWKKQAGAPFEAITTDTIRRLEANPMALTHAQRDEVDRLARQYQFFHWHLAFPEVFAKGGFDCVLGNPPWERVKLQEREFFAESRPDIANAATAALRGRLIRELADSDPALFWAYLDALRRADAESHFARTSGRFPYGASGDTNTYPLFVELATHSLLHTGRAGIIVKTGILADFSLRKFFEHLVEEDRLVSAFDFSNAKLIFQDVVANERFTLLTLGGSGASGGVIAVSILNQAMADLELPGRRWRLSRNDIRLINPNTHTCPLFQTQRDAHLIGGIYRRHRILIREGDVQANSWAASYFTMFHMTNDSSLFRDLETLQRCSTNPPSLVWFTDEGEYVGLLEGKLYDLFDHRHGTFEGVPRESRFGIKAEPNHLSDPQKQRPDDVCLPRYWVPASEVRARYAEQLGFQPNGVLTFRDVCRTHTDLRTVRASICPPVGAGNKAPLLLFPGIDIVGHAVCSALLCANLASFVLDYIARQKFSGGSLNRFIIIQFPVIERYTHDERCPWTGPESGVSYLRFLLPRISELTYTTLSLEAFAHDCGWSGPPFRWDEERRFLLRCELDAAFFHLYLPAEANGEWRPAERETAEDLARLKASFPTPRDAVAHMMDTFPIVKRRDIEKHGDYRTKRVILEIYDAMQEAIRTGQPYQTRLDPPPADPRCCHPPREAGAEGSGAHGQR